MAQQWAFKLGAANGQGNAWATRGRSWAIQYCKVIQYLLVDGPKSPGYCSTYQGHSIADCAP